MLGIVFLSFTFFLDRLYAHKHTARVKAQLAWWGNFILLKIFRIPTGVLSPPCVYFSYENWLIKGIVIIREEISSALEYQIEGIKCRRDACVKMNVNYGS